MSPSDFREAAKKRLSLSGTTTYDTLLDDMVTQSVNRLSPRAMIETDADTVSVSVDDYGEASASLLSLAIDDVRKVEAYDGTTYSPADNKYLHNYTLYVRDLSTDVTELRIYGLKKYDAAEVPTELQLAVIWFIMSEFFDYMASHKGQYNQYLQTTGARAVDNMRDESLYYEQKANTLIDENAQIYGSQ